MTFGPRRAARPPAPLGAAPGVEELRRLFDALPDGLLICDRNGHIARLNRRLEDMSGYRAEDLVGRPVETLIPERSRHVHRQHREGFMEQPHVRRMDAGRNLTLRRRDGTELPVDIALSPLETGDGLAVMCAIRDASARASERERAGEELREAEARYRAIFENAVEGIFQTSLDGRYLAANSALARMLGYESAEELMACVTDVRQIYVEPGGRDQFIERVQRHGSLPEYEYQVLRKDGTAIWVSEKVRVLRDPAGELIGFEGMTLDVTERKRAEEALRRRDAILGAVTFAAGRFLSAASWREAIDEVLARMGEAAGASRVSIYEIHEDEGGRQLASHRHEWTAPGVEPQIGNPQLRSVPRGASPVDRWFDVLGAGGTIHGRVADFPEGERPFIRSQGIESLSIVPIFVEGQLWGTISLADCLGEGAWAAAEIDALRTAADTLGATIRRQRVEEELRLVVHNQGALAQLGQMALVGTDLPTLMDETVTVVARTLEVDYAKILELLPSGGELLLRAGVGWTEGLVGRATVSAGLESQAGFTLLSDEPVVVEDLSTETRFTGPALLQDHGVVSGMSVIIRGRDRAFGVLGAHARSRRAFSEFAVHFLQSVANILSEAIERKRAEEELQESLMLLRRTDAARRGLLVHLVRVEEEERSRIAGDIHDDPLQKVSAVGLRLGALKSQLDDPRHRAQVGQLEDTVALAIKSLRSLLFEVHPPALDREGLAAALREYLREVAGEGGFDATLEDRLGAEPASQTQVICYRVTREAIVNAKKHAGATRLEVTLESRGNGVLVRIADDGVGFTPGSAPDRKGHLGLSDMLERVEMVGGWLRIDSAPGAGATVEFWVPSIAPEG